MSDTIHLSLKYVVRRVWLIWFVLATAAAACAGYCGSRKSVGENKAEQTRRFHIINMSLPRTGSGSLWGLFSKYRSSHEFMPDETIEAMLAHREKKLARGDLDSFLRKRDAAELLEMDSANFMYLEPENVVADFPEARFYLAVREGKEWIVSFLDLRAANFGSPKRARGTDRRWANRYGRVISPRFDTALFSDRKTLKAHVEPLLPDFADFWGRSTYVSLQALRNLPAERRLIIYKRDLTDSVDMLASLAQIEKSALDLSKVHLNKDVTLKEIENLFGAEKIERSAAPWQKKINEYIAENKLIGK